MSSKTTSVTLARPAIQPSRSVDWPVGPDKAELSRQLSHFEPISLAEMDDLALLNRVDTKFVMREEQLLSALAHLTGSYRVLEIRGRRLNDYQTLYFDTRDFALFRQHHAGALNRYKVRAREYVDTRASFLEVKFKTNKSRTIKIRRRTPDLMTEFDEPAEDFLRQHYPFDTQTLEPVLENAFTRITLASKHACERLTLDLNLRFYAPHAYADLSGLAIAEVKQDGFSPRSDFFLQMRAHGIRSTTFSKYCVGVSLLYEDVKSNRFKPKLLMMERLLGELNDDERSN